MQRVGITSFRGVLFLNPYGKTVLFSEFYRCRFEERELLVFKSFYLSKMLYQF